MRNWKNKGTPNHLLVNNIVDFGTEDFLSYFEWYSYWYEKRFGKGFNESYIEEVRDFCYSKMAEKLTPHKALMRIENIYSDWMNEDYLRVCMANLYEKWKFGQGKNKLRDQDWAYLLFGYKEITGKDYFI